MGIGELEKITMSPRLNRMWLLPVLLLASQSWALGLGDIRLSSALNEPLRAEIQLLGATPEEMENLRVQLASLETFERYDLDRPLFLSRLQFRLIRSGSSDGNIVSITSVEPVTEPFITFLVEASWTRGRLLREYTLLLDPPTFAPPPVTQSTQAITAPTRAAQTDSGQIQRPAPQQPAPTMEPEPVVQAPVEAPAPSAQIEEPSAFEPAPEPAPAFDEVDFDRTTGGEVLVLRGDTLWAITSRVRPDSRLTMNQTMLAIFEANPQAFAGNINVMSAGATLRIPSADEIFRISRGDALAEVQRQNAAWGGAAPDIDTQTQPALTLLPPDDDVGVFDDDVDQAGVDDAAQALIDADETRINEIEALLADHQDSLIVLTDNELAALRVELAELRGEEPPEPMPVEDIIDETLADETIEDPFVDEGEDELVADEFVDDELEPTAVDEDLVADEDLVDDTAAPVEAEDTTPATVVAVDTPRRQVSLLDTILGYVNSIWGIIGGALIIAVGLLVWFARRAGGGDDEDSTGMWESLEQDDIDEETMASTERLRALAKEDDSAIVVVEQETAPPRSIEDSMAETFEMPAVEEQVSVTETIVEAAGPEPVADSPIEDSMIDTFEMPAADEIEATDFSPGFDETPEFDETSGLDETAEVPVDISAETSAEISGDETAEVPIEEPVEEHISSMVDESAVAEITPDTLLDDTFHSDTAINLDQADPVAEADFHMAYGLYDQAADLINGALEVDPEREDLLAKLCEIYFVWGNRDAFIDAADKLRGVASGDENPEWDKIVIMGQQIAADHEMFSGVSPAAATKAVDLSFEGGEDAGELDIDFEATEGDATQAVDLSFDAPTDEGGDLDIDFEAGASGQAEVIDLGEEGAEPSTADSFLEEDTSEMPAAGSDSPTIEQQFDSLDETGEMPATEEAASDDATEIANVFDDEHAAATRPPTDETAEIDLDDLGLDLEGIDDTQIAGDDDLDDQISGLDDTSESQTIDDLTITGKNLAVGEEQLGATGIQRALSDDDMTSETGEIPAIEEPTDTNLALPDTKSIDDTDVEIDIGLLDATGQTQALSDDMAVDTAADAGASLSDEDETMLAGLSSDESTVLAPDVDLDFAKTQELDETGEVPALGGEMAPDVDMDDLTGILEVTQVGDSADADRDAETAQMPHVTQTDIDPDAVDLDIGDDSPTMAASPDDVAGDSDDARTMTEVGTKLDLARAYVDMGDPNGARSILEEVLNEGDEGQRQQAQQLLESMPSG
jgi:pilus assembly protein FimV